MATPEIPIQDKVRNFLYEVADAKRSQPDYEEYLRKQLKTLTEAELHELRTQVESSERVPEVFRRPDGPERAVILKLSRERLEELKNSIFEKSKKAVGDMMPGSWSPETKKAVTVAGIAVASVAAVYVGYRVLRAVFGRAKEEADSASGAARKAGKGLLVGGAIWLLKWTAIVGGILGGTWLGSRWAMREMLKVQMAASKATFNKVLKGVLPNRKAKDRNPLHALKLLGEELDAAYKIFPDKSSSKFLGFLPGFDFSKEQKEFLAEFGFDPAKAPQKVMFPGPDCRYEITFDPSQKDKFVIKAIDITETLKDPIDSTIPGMLAINNLTSAGPAGVDLKDFDNIKFLLNDADVRKMKIKDLDEIRKEANFAVAKTKAPLNLPKFAANERLQRSLWFVAKMSGGAQNVDKFIPGLKDETGKMLAGRAVIQEITIAQFIEYTGTYYRVGGRFQDQAKKGNMAIAADLVKAAAETLNRKNLGKDFSTAIPLRDVRTIEPAALKDIEAEFVQYCQDHGATPISTINADADVLADASLDAATMDNVRKGAVALAKRLKDPASDVRKVIDDYLKKTGIADADTTFNKAANAMTLSDALQLHVFAEQMRFDGKFDGTDFDGSNMMGFDLLRLKLTEMIGREDADVAKKVYDKLVHS